MINSTSSTGLEAGLLDALHSVLGDRARRSSAGYDLTLLFIGSEGTLGVVTEIALRLQGIPESMVSAVCSFPTLEDAVNAVILTVQRGVPVARAEGVNTRMVERAIKSALDPHDLMKPGKVA